MPVPEIPRSVEQQHWLSERSCGEQHVRCLSADMAIRDDGVSRLHARLRENLAELGGRFEFARRIVQRVERNTLRSRNVAETPLWSAAAARRRHAVVE